MGWRPGTDERFDDNSGSHFELGDVDPDLGYNSGNFMSAHHGILGVRVLSQIKIHVARTDAGSPHRDKSLAGSGPRRFPGPHLHVEGRLNDRGSQGVSWRYAWSSGCHSQHAEAWTWIWTFCNKLQARCLHHKGLQPCGAGFQPVEVHAEACRGGSAGASPSRVGGLSDLKGKALIQTNYTTRNNGSSPRKTRKAFSAVS